MDYDDLLESFLTETVDMLNESENSLLELEQGFDGELVNSVFRAFHTIKGDSGVFGLQKITDLAHSLENMLNLIRNQELEISMSRIDILLTGIDLLRQMISDINEIDKISIEDIMEQLHKSIGAGDDLVDIKPATMEHNIVDSHGSHDEMKIEIKKEWKLLAREQKKYLSVVFMDLLDQKQVSSLVNIRSSLQLLEYEKTILMQGVLSTKLPGINPESKSILPYYLIVLTPQEPIGFLAESGLFTVLLKAVYSPLENSGVVGEDEIVSKELSALIPENEDAGNEGDVFVYGDSPVVKEKVESDVVDSSSGMIVAHVRKPKIENVVAESKKSFKMDVSTDSYLKVSIDLLDDLINIAGETIIARNTLVQASDDIDDQKLSAATRKISYFITKLQESIMKTRMQEIGTVFQRLPRLVRDVSKITGKKVELITNGGDVELDKTLVDVILDPLMHMVRNSIDHGIESPVDRLKLGKPEVGRLEVKAYLRGGNVIVDIVDDGKGIDIEKIRQKALKIGLLNEDMAETVTDEEILDLIFEPGFTTNDEVSKTSGRGVGMDVVRTNFKKVNGSVDVRSVLGEGTAITATIPQTLSIITTLMVNIDSQQYAIPQQNIESIVLLEVDKLVEVEDHLMYNLRDSLFPLVELDALFDEDKAKNSKQDLANRYVVFVYTDRHRFGLIVDNIMNPEEIVVKPLGAHFSAILVFAGAAILGNGDAILILDVLGIARHAKLQSNKIEKKVKQELLTERKPNEGLLITGTGNNRFAVPVGTKPRIERISSELIEVFMGLESIVFENEIVPLIRLEDVFGLDGRVESENINIMIFNMDSIRVGIPIENIYDVISDYPNFEAGGFIGEGILGQFVLNDLKVVVLDIKSVLGRVKGPEFNKISSYVSEKNHELVSDSVEIKEK